MPRQPQRPCSYPGCPNLCDVQYCDTIKTVRGVLRPAFQMAVDDDILNKNPFSFELATVVVNDSVTLEAITREQMRKFLKFVHDDNVYCKYYEVVYIFFHTGMRISEFCGLTLSDIDLKNRIINIDHQIQRMPDMRLVIESTKTNAGTRKLPITADVAHCFQAIIEDRPKPKFEKMIDGYTGFLFLDGNGNPLVAMHWEHRTTRNSLRKRKGVCFGRPEKGLPPEFVPLIKQWEKKRISLDEILKICKISESTFYRRLREYRIKKE